MRLINDDELDMVSGGRKSAYRPPSVDKGGTLPADDCPVYKYFGNWGLCAHEIKHDCINCAFYDYHVTNKCTNPGGIRFGK